MVLATFAAPDGPRPANEHSRDVVRQRTQSDSTSSVLEAPMRAELYSIAQLEQHARSLGVWHQLAPAAGRVVDQLLPRLDSNEDALREAHALVTEGVRRGRRITPAAEWFVDNYHLIEEQIRTARRHLPRNYSRELPRLAKPVRVGVPRVYDLVLDLVSHSHGRLDLDGLRAFITSYQSLQTLRLGELWAIPIMLRLALIENLRRVVAGVAAGRRDRETAGRWVEKMVETAAAAPAKLVLVLAEMVGSNPPQSDAFFAELATRLQGLGPTMALPMSWLEQRLAERGDSLEHVFQQASQSQAADQVSVANSIGSLRSLGAVDWQAFVESMSVVEARLTRDPAGIYRSMDFATRDRYRHVVEEIARRSSSSEEEVADAAVELSRAGKERCRHVGFHLVGEGRQQLERAVKARGSVAKLVRRVVGRHRLAMYLGCIVGLGVAATVAVTISAIARGLPTWATPVLAVLVMIAVSQLAVALTQWAATMLVTPRVLPRLDLSDGIPAAMHTVVAVPTMLTDLAEIDGLLEALEVRHLANRDANLSFALVTDFRDAPTEHLESDAGLLQHAIEGIETLNRRYAHADAPPIFHLFHRARRWNPSQRSWMGWERKRGKLEQFNGALRGKLDAFDTIVGDAEHLADVKYVIVLDSDTHLPRDSARELVATMAHPLNQPRFDADLGRVVDGYAILQPRVAITMASTLASGFARLFAGQPGIDPYTRAVSDVYQDVFGEGSFVGKGIYDVDAFEAALAGKLPENRILSHDLLEGAYARAGLVSDVLLFEDYPSAYTVEVSRRNRWMRGDWQITPWLGRRVPGAAKRTRNPISLLSQWKILDNLRRSLVPVALVALLVLGWLLPGQAALSTLVVLGVLVLPGLFITLTGLARRPDELTRTRHVRDLAAALGTQLGREGFALACLPYDAQVSVMAILRTGVRIWFTRRRLLEWRTAADAQRTAKPGLLRMYGLMAVAPLLAIAIAAWYVMHPGPAVAWAAPVLSAWMLGPLIAWWSSRPRAAERSSLQHDDVRFLRRIARRTWRFFENYVVAEDNHLPPDNFQIDPPQGIAHRTSPTNIGLALTANLAAYDFGFVSAHEVVTRTAATLQSLERMERHRGHFYNWYDTRTLEPLRPKYVSTVDSGNLAAYLLTLAAGLRALAGDRIVRFEAFAGLHDALDVLAELAAEAPELLAEVQRVTALLDAAPRRLGAMRTVLDLLCVAAPGLIRLAVSRHDDEIEGWARAFEADAQQAMNELDRIAPWVALPGALGVEGLDVIPSLGEAAALERTLASALEHNRELREAVALGSSRAMARLVEVDRLATLATELADCEYEFLYDRERRLLAIGYNVADHRIDASFYDLLASEARLASFVAIAQGKLPQEHWFSLGRLVTTTDGRPALLSWSGSMFEYLMPVLVMPTYRGSILDETYRGVVQRQIAYGQERGVPWGVSESGYNKTDAQLNYQYRAFGVPGLGFKRGLADDLVVAPYASAMALMIAPKAACENLRLLAAEGRLGSLGFYEAIDYTYERLPRGKPSVTIASYMAHHQGMAFLSIAYALLDRPMQRRFEADPSFRAIDLLLQERVPRSMAIFPHPGEVAPGGATLNNEPNLRLFKTPNTRWPQVQLLSNGTYHVMVTNAGGGYSRWRDLAVTRWNEDVTRDACGSFCYLRDVASGKFWSTAHQPTGAVPTSYEAIFSQGRAEFRRRDEDIVTHVELGVSPEDDVELRVITLTNAGDVARTIEVTSFAEVVLDTPAADAAHRAFSSLFVQTELVPSRQAILCTRRPRSGSERPPWMLHLMTVQGRVAGSASFETSRLAFVGRGHSVIDPAAMHVEALGGHFGAVLDPIAAIRNAIVLQPDESVRVHLVTGMAETRELAIGLIEKYTDRHSADRVFELSWTHGQVLLRRLDATEADTQLYDRLASHMLYSSPVLRAPASVIARNRGGQSGLWAYAISGDLPIMLVRIGDREHLGLVRHMVRAHAYLRLKGLSADLVIWNEDPSGYRQVLQDEITSVIAAQGELDLLDRPGGIFVRRSEQITEEDKVLMQTVARVIVFGGDGTLAEHLDRRLAGEAKVAAFVPRDRAERSPKAPTLPQPRADLVAWNGYGGFTPDGREYVMTTGGAGRTPAPWVNVLANPYFGTVVSESGGAYTWCENARNYRLTPWHNDPVSDPSGEAFYIRDENTGRFWSPTSSPAGSGEPYTTRHGFGYSVFEHTNDGIVSELQTYVATDAPIKFLLFKLKNRSGRPRRISLTGLFELVLGERRPGSGPHVVTAIEPSSGALLGRNAYAGEFARRVAFLDCSEAQRTYTGDLGEFIGRNGNLADPACMARARLSGRIGAALDPCLAMQVMIDLADGQEREVVFSLGSGLDLNDARTLIHRFRGVGGARSALEGVWSYWNRTLGAVHIDTPDQGLNFLVNGWLMYQTLAARMWARSGFYQSGGAFGFRDQLQDAMALVHAEPAILRDQIVRAAGRQFHEGDVQHWWHPPMGRGVRTRISDDYLWLPYAVCRYVGAIGDTGVLAERAPFLEGRPVKPDEDSYYDLPLHSEESGTVYEHCVRAIENGLRFGEHGLPLMGSGDWNDGMNLVGDHGKGESVWLGFFLYDVLVRFAELATRQGDSTFADKCRTTARRLAADLEAHAWDGGWYRRAYFDSGDPIGSASSVDCQIDSLPQSWAVLTAAGDPERARQAIAAVDARLVDREHGLIKLFDPPFDRSELNPGYVKGYVPGVRENGGQYTHAAVWAVMAVAAAGDVARAWELFNLINPVHHGDSARAIDTYAVEPYVVAADVYTNPQHVGRGGWSWYTGSAGWMYRVALESLLGIRLEVDRLRVDPLLPAGWEHFEVHYRFRSSTVHIRVHGPVAGGRGVQRVVCDGVERTEPWIPLVDDGREHHAEVWVGALPGTPG